MSDGNDVNGKNFIKYAIDNSVIARANAVSIPAF